MIPSLAYNKDGKIENIVSPYQPSAEVKDMSAIGRLDLESADEILNRPFAEFNDMSIIERMNLDQKDWMAWSSSPSDNPDESWMFTGTSSATRNKIISTAAHLTTQVIFPQVFAQNEEDEEDIAAGTVMRHTLEYNANKTNWEQTFLYAVIQGLVNPVSYLEIDYIQKFQDVLEGTQDNFTRKQVIDEVFSGFQNNLLPGDEVLLANPYCFDIQKQPYIIKRRRITFTEARSIYQDHESFEHVRPGLVSVLNASDGLFYDVDDQLDDNLVEEVTFKYRGRDVEYTEVNGVYLGNSNTEYNPMVHRRVKKDGTDVPVYNIVKFGAEPIDAQRFAYYKSLAAKLANDKELVDRMRQNAVDASTFATFPSMFTVGAGKLDKSVFIPATVVDLDKDAKVFPATGTANPTFSINAAKSAEQDMNETSLDPQLSGISGTQKTRGEAVLLQQNAFRNLGIMGSMIGQMIKESGELQIDDVIRYQTVGEMVELSGGALGMKYLTMILNDKIISGQKQSVVIRFTDAWMGEMTKEEKRKKEVALFQEAGEDKLIYEVNPVLFATRQFSIVVEPDALKPKNETLEIERKLVIYDRAINNPLIAQNPEKMAQVTRDFLFEPTVQGEGAKYIPKADEITTMLSPAPTQVLKRNEMEKPVV